MAASSSAKKGKLNVEDKVKSKKYNHSYVKDIAGKGKAVHSLSCSRIMIAVHS